MTKAAAKTGAGPTVMVAVEQGFPAAERLIDDDLARRILPFGSRAVTWLTRTAWLRDAMIRAAERSVPGIWAGIMCRKRYIDDLLSAAADDLEAVVNLGAGFDTRLYRLPKLAAIPAWEIDQPQNVARKKARLEHVFGRVPSHVTLVAVDFDRESLEDALARHGFSRTLRTFYVWEAVTQYLAADAFASTFTFLAGAAPGSHLAFTYVRQDFLDKRELYGQAALHEKYVVQEKAWHVGLEPESVDELLAKHGWQLVQHLGYEDLAERYVAPTRRQLASTPIERIVYARRGVRENATS
jgi:methyltransferase (TIGR00027 family)